MVGPSPRVSRWKAARPTSWARYQPISGTGRYRSMATSPLRIRSARSLVTPPPQTITVISMAWPSQT